MDSKSNKDNFKNPQPWPSCNNLRNVIRNMISKGIDINDILNTPVIATEKIDGSNVSIDYLPESNTFGPLRTRRMIIPNSILNSVNLSSIFDDTVKSKVVSLWNIINENIANYIDEPVTNLIIFGEVYIGVLNYNYGEDHFWKPFGFKLVSESNPMGKTFWLTQHVMELFSSVGFTFPPIIDQDTMGNIIKKYHQKMMDNSIEGIFITPVDTTNFNYGIKYKVGIMDDCPQTFLFFNKKMSKLADDEHRILIEKYGSDKITIIRIIDQVFFNHTKKKKSKKEKNMNQDILISMISEVAVLSELSKINLPDKEEFNLLERSIKKKLISDISKNIYQDIITSFRKEVTEEDYMIKSKTKKMMDKRINGMTSMIIYSKMK